MKGFITKMRESFLRRVLPSSLLLFISILLIIILDKGGSKNSSSLSKTETKKDKIYNRTITGDPIETQFGVIKIEIILDQENKIIGINNLEFPSEGLSKTYSESALPILESEAISSQSASIDFVSGATYTSEGYIKSLQSAVDKI